MSDPYVVFGPDPTHEEGSRYLTADQMGVGDSASRTPSRASGF